MGTEQKLVLRIDDDPNTAARDRSIERVFEVHRGDVGLDQPGVSADPILRDFQHGRREIDSSDVAVRLSTGQALREQPGPDAQFEHLLPVSHDCIGGSCHGVVVVVTTSHEKVVAIGDAGVLIQGSRLSTGGQGPTGIPKRDTQATASATTRCRWPDSGLLAPSPHVERGHARAVRW